MMHRDAGAMLHYVVLQLAREVSCLDLALRVLLPIPPLVTKVFKDLDKLTQLLKDVSELKERCNEALSRPQQALGPVPSCLAMSVG